MDNFSYVSSNHDEFWSASIVSYFHHLTRDFVLLLKKKTITNSKLFLSKTSSANSGTGCVNKSNFVRDTCFVIAYLHLCSLVQCLAAEINRWQKIEWFKLNQFIKKF